MRKSSTVATFLAVLSLLLTVVAIPLSAQTPTYKVGDPVTDPTTGSVAAVSDGGAVLTDDGLVILTETEVGAVLRDPDDRTKTVAFNLGNMFTAGVTAHGVLEQSINGSGGNVGDAGGVVVLGDRGAAGGGPGSEYQDHKERCDWIVRSEQPRRIRLGMRLDAHTPRDRRGRRPERSKVNAWRHAGSPNALALQSICGGGRSLRSDAGSIPRHSFI